MFQFVKERKAKAALEAVVPGTLALLRSVPSPHRAAVLAVANALLLVGAGEWGREFSHAPMKLPQDRAYDAICALADRHAQIEAAIDDLAGRPPSDPQVDACRWELAAVQVVMVTAAASLSRDYAYVARQVWKMLAPSRRHAQEAAKAMMRYSKAYSASPIPEVKGRKLSEQWLVALASSMPPMFRNSGAS